MIKRFKVGKWYRWIGPKERPFKWAPGGEMDEMLEGLPHQCTVINEDRRSWAVFQGIPENIGIKYWDWVDLANFEKVPRKEIRALYTRISAWLEAEEAKDKE